MNVVRLLVLGVILEQGPSHGYAIRQTLEGWQIGTWTHVHSGSIAHALQQMAKEGLLEPGPSHLRSRGPAKLTYVITDAGRAEFGSELDQALSSFDIVALSAGIAFLGRLSRPEAQARLSATIGKLEENVAHLKTLAAQAPDDFSAPRIKDVLELWRANLSAMSKALERIRARAAEPS